jgi:hypothetical protein
MDLRVSAISFSSVGSATTYGASPIGQRPPPAKDGRDPMSSVAKALGLSTNDVKAQLRNGKSLNDLADSAGVAHDDLIAAIKAGLPRDGSGARSSTATASAAAASATSSTAATTAAARMPAVNGSGATDPTAIAERIAASKGRPPTPPRAPSGPDGPSGVAGASSSAASSSAASSLGASSSGASSSGASASAASSVVGNEAKLSQLSDLFDVDGESLNSASSPKEVLDVLQRNGADLSRLKNVLNSGDLLNTTA